MKQRGTLLLVDDDRHVLASMADWLRDQGYQTDTAASLAEATAAVDRKTYDLVLADIRLGDDDGFDVLAHCRRKQPAAAVIMITGYGTVESAVEAIRLGAFDFLTKPLIDEELQMAIQRALDQRKVIEENRLLEGPARPPLRHGEHRRPRPPHVEDLRHDRQRGRHPRHRAHHRRERHGQVDDRPGHPPPQRPPRPGLRRGGLRRPARNAAGKRAVRPRGRRLHRRRRRQDGQVHAGRRRHDLPRRSLHRQPRHAGQAAPRAAGPRIRAGRRHQDLQDRHPRDPGHQRGPRPRRWPRAASARTCSIAST